MLLYSPSCKKHPKELRRLGSFREHAVAAGYSPQRLHATSCTPGLRRVRERFSEARRPTLLGAVFGGPDGRLPLAGQRSSCCSGTHPVPENLRDFLALSGPRSFRSACASSQMLGKCLAHPCEDAPELHGGRKHHRINSGLKAKDHGCLGSFCLCGLLGPESSEILVNSQVLHCLPVRGGATLGS